MEDKKIQPSILEKIDQLLDNKFKIIDILEPSITKFVKSLAEVTNGKICGLEHRKKTKESAKRKISDYCSTTSITVEDALKQIKDLLRYTIVYESDVFAESVKNAKRIIQVNSNYTLLRINNRMSSNNGYRDIQSNIEELEYHEIFELQFHTPNTYKAKQVSHHIYEILRENPKNLNPKQVVKLNEAIKDLYALFTEIPKDIEQIKNQ